MCIVRLLLNTGYKAQDYKTGFMLNSSEHEIYQAH